MRRTLILACVTLFIAAVAAAHERKETIHYPSLAGDAGAYLSLPESHGNHPAVIVIQEWWGLNDWVKEQADRFAAKGYVALAPDLYRGKVASDPNAAHELMRGLAHDRAMADLTNAVKYLATRKDVDATRIGVIGWCMGGGYALDLALAEPRIAATVINYGHLVADPAAVKPLTGPILGNFGEKDQGIPPKDVDAFEKALKAAGKSSDIKVYPGCGHAFMNPNNTQGYVKAAADDAWKRIDAFFAKALKLS